MLKRLFIFFSFSTFSLVAQVDYSDAWEDFYSYNNVKDLIKADNMLYALTDNATFTYDFITEKTEKLSSVQGLSGETTSAIHYSIETNRLVIGYENGLIEVIDSDGSITISSDIVSFNQTGAKSINAIFEDQGKLYLSTSFAIVEYDILQLEFGDTFFVGNNSSEINIIEITVFNNQIYAATANGIFHADINNPNLIDFNNWSLITSANNNFKNTLYRKIDGFISYFDNTNKITFSGTSVLSPSSSVGPLIIILPTMTSNKSSWLKLLLINLFNMLMSSEEPSM